MSVTLDANVLVYASNPLDPAHERAVALIAELAAGPGLVHLFWPTVMGYLRLVTHPAILSKPLTPQTAVANVEALLSRPHVRTPSETGGFWGLYRSVAGDRARGNEVPDAHLASLMRQHGVGTIYTRDRGFRRFEGITPVDPFS